MLGEHLGEVEFDFRSILHTSLRDVADADEEEGWRLLSILTRRSDSQTAAALAGWDQPWSLNDFLTASVYSAWAGAKHPLLPDHSGPTASEAEVRLADTALENMNRR